MLVIHVESGANSKEIPASMNTMNMSYSFHPLLAAPRILSSGLFNCSVPHYDHFKQHLDCNLRHECQGGEDEGAHCPFNSTCDGWMDAQGKCYFLVIKEDHVTWQRARVECKTRGGDLAMMKTPKEWAALRKLYDYEKRWKCAYIGLRLNASPLLPMYRKTWSWADGTKVFDVNVSESSTVTSRTSHYNEDVEVNVNQARLVKGFRAGEKECSRYICQIQNNSNRLDDGDWRMPLLSANVSVHTAMELGLTHCPAGHLVHNFMQCYTGSLCGAEGVVKFCDISTDNMWRFKASSSVEPLRARSVSIAMFECDSKRGTVPYTLVCDFRPDCTDHSDEILCQHRVDCGERFYRCKNEQCIELTKRCDNKKDCKDASDEDQCRSYPFRDPKDFVFQEKRPAPSVISYIAGDTYEQTTVNSFKPCPDQYFQCPQSKHCLPVYLRCNDVSDCSQHEDELGCGNHTCTGFYQCNGTTVCLHVTHLCDGVAQCLWRDDEMLCGSACPPGCLCLGLEFVCRQPFPAGDFTQLRYLDARYSNMTLGDFTLNSYLMYLDLSSCALLSIDKINVPNLRYLDVSKNFLFTLDMDALLTLQQLRTLLIQGNPLTEFTGGISNDFQRRLTVLDLSETSLKSFTSEPLRRYISIQTINMSFCKVTTIAEEGFQFVPTLKQLDLRGNVIEKYPRNLFKILDSIRLIYTDNYKLCCPDMLPMGHEEDLCLSPQDEISSCDDLLRSDVYRLSLWLMCLASVLGNLGCLVFRNVILHRKSVGSFSTFVSSLSASDCVMGFYLCILGVADQVYRGVYYLYEDTWLSSIACTVSGVLSLLSSEVSAITICFVTLDRLIVLRFPFSTVKFTKKAATVACVLIWMTGLSLSLAPLSQPHWGFYSQTGICIPLPVTRQDFKGRDYSFSVMIVLNLILFLLIAAGQVIINHSIRMNSMMVDTRQKQQDVTITRRLITVAVSDFVCWFPIGLLGLLASVEVPIPGEVNVAMAIFILPLNSALNPFLYTFNMLLEKRRKAKERYLLEYLESLRDKSSVSVNSPATLVSCPAVDTDSVTACGDMKKEKLLSYLHSALEQQLVSYDQVRDVVLSSQDIVQ